MVSAESSTKMCATKKVPKVVNLSIHHVVLIIDFYRCANVDAQLFLASDRDIDQEQQTLPFIV